MLDEEVAFAGVAGQVELVHRGDVSARELAELALGRIERLDRELNAFGAIFDDHDVLLTRVTSGPAVPAGIRRA